MYTCKIINFFSSISVLPERACLRYYIIIIIIVPGYTLFVHYGKNLKGDAK